VRNKNIIVVGGGASGMTAAIFAANAGAEVTVLEKNDALGRKLSITGKGRCNLANDCAASETLANIPGNPEFLYSSVYGFDGASVINFFNSLGVATKVERGRRVFPASDKAGDVVSALTAELKKLRVGVRYGCAVKSLIIDDKKIAGVKLRSGEKIFAGAVLIATGGASYPQTGSSGDGYAIAKQAGHVIIAPRPSLVPLIAEEGWAGELEGLTLKNVRLTAYANEKKIYSEQGEMLFTSRGVSGPLVLTASRYISDHLAPEFKIYLSIDLKPALDENALDKRLTRDFAASVNKDFKNSLSELFPRKLIPVMITLSGIPDSKKINAVTKAERRRLLGLIKALRLTVTGTEGFNQAVVTRGGVSVAEINPSSMESKLIEGLYFSGEVIDVDGLTGGFNLHIAFATGALAGRSMARRFGRLRKE